MNGQRISSEILDRLPPQDLNAEKCVLGSILCDPKVIDDLTLTPDDFYADANQKLYRQFLAMRADHKPVDVVLLMDRLTAAGEFEAIGGAAYLREVAGAVPYAFNAKYYAGIVLDRARRRAVIHAATEALRDAWAVDMPVTEILEAAESSLAKIRTHESEECLVDGPAAALAFTDHVQKIVERRGRCGLMTGLWKFDEIFGGLFPGEYIILAADSSAGKTSLAAQIADYIAERGMLVYFASLEMESLELTQRIVCGTAKVNSRKVRTGNICEDDIAALANGATAFSRRSIRIDPRTSLKVSDIRRSARRLVKDGLQLVVVDYIGLIEPDDHRTSREQQVARISRGLKNLAKELDVPVIALCQLNREHQSNERPALRNLRESGAIGNDAHMVIFLHKPLDGIVDVEWETTTDQKGKEVHKRRDVKREWPAEMILAKNRNGETGTVKLGWTPEETKFWCWDTPQNQPNYESAFEEGAF